MTAGIQHAEASFAAFAARRLLGVAAVVVLTPSLTFVVLGSLRDGTMLWTQAAKLPRYLSDTFLHLDFGIAGTATQPQRIRDLVLDGMPVDLALVAGALVLGVAVGVTTGTICGARRRDRIDRVLTVGSAAALSVPVYWLGLAVLFVFAPDSGYVHVSFVSSSGGYVPLTEDPLGWLRALWVPWVVLAIPLAAACHRMVRASLPEVLDDDALRTARGKGLPERIVMRRHALPLALPPVIGLVSVNMALLITNTVLIEPAFQLPGAFRRADVGQFLGENSHIPPLEIVQALIVEAAFIIAVAMLICDLLQAALDPRLRAPA